MSTDIETGDQIYVPKPGIVAWRVLTHLLVHPAEVLMRKDVAALTGCPQASVDAMLQTAVVRGCLSRYRNEKMEMTWRLASVKTFRLDPLPQGGQEPQAQAPAKPPAPAPAPTPAPIPAPTPAPAPKPPQTQAAALYVPGTADLGQQNTIPVRARVDQRPPAAPAKRESSATTDAPKPQVADAPARMTVAVAMPLHLTTELIEAVRNDPKTSFENKADGHHAIGWLHDAYDVMVKAQTQAASRTTIAPAHSQ